MPDHFVPRAHGGGQIGVVDIGDREAGGVGLEDQERCGRRLEQPREKPIRLYPRGYVRRRPEPFCDLPSVIEERGSARGRPSDRTVREQYTMLQLEDGLGSNRPVDRFANQWPFTGRNVPINPADGRNLSVGKEGSPFEVMHLAPVWAHTIDRGRSDRCQCAKLRLAFKQRCFGKLASVDVDVHADPLHDAPIRIKHGGRANIGPAPTATWCMKAKLRVDQAACGDSLAPLLLGIGPVVGMNCLQPTVAKPLFDALTRVGTPAWAVGYNHAVRIAFPLRLRPTTDQ